MSSILEVAAYILATGFLVRADGWGPENDEVAKTWLAWKLRLAKFFNAWSCGGLFTLLSLFYFPPLVALACGAAFVVYRIFGFNPWRVWRYMFVRGLWTSAIGFALIGLAAHGNLWFVLASIPFAVLYATIYSRGYKYLPQTILGFGRHVWIEHPTGWLLGVFIVGAV